MTTPNGIRTESTRTPKASRAGALHSTPLYVTPRQNRRQPVIHRYGPNARPATIAATGSHSPAPTMDESPTANGGGMIARCLACGRLLIEGQTCVCGGGR